MEEPRNPSPKRPREDEDDYVDAIPRKRSASHSPNASPNYHLAERPARRYSRRSEDDSDTERRYYRERRTRSRSPSHTRSSHSRSSSPRTAAPPKPTALHYTPTLILHGHKKPISCVKFSPCGLWIASSSSDCTIKLWSALTGTLEHTLEGHLAGISILAWSPDSRLLASGSDDKSIRLWHTSTGLAHPTPLLGHHNYIYALAFSPQGNMLVSGSYDEAVFLWDVRAARVIHKIPAHSDPVSGVDFVRDGTLITSCSHDGLIRVWDTATGQCLRTLVHEDNAPVSSVVFSPNGKYVLAWTLDSCVRLWDYVEGKGKCVKTYQGHVNRKFSLSGTFGTYGADAPGKHQFAFIASGSEDCAVWLWDVSSKNVLQRLEGHAGAVLSVHTHPTEKAIVSAGVDRTVRVWRFKEPGPGTQRQDGVVEAALGQGVNGDGMNGVGGEQEHELPPYPFA
ncbi:WD40 repeat-like protein [Lophiostoma macrostomum CBS 122681]|uniref:Mitochondrial division protein 1 n=1 Tax=Lophiostoma macrostomum CBS 122681 TaxID=1314788 RepID=A0A6A6TT73_9PLEO|nr:WD40 repeat-like protein [Lophiostoma macrostomum CBS 122681]